MTDRIDIKIDVSGLTKKLGNLNQLRNQAMPLLYTKFRDVTPIDTGAARNNTVFHSNVIEGNYPYASVLNDGRGFRDGQMRGSTQAPDGMVEPTKAYARQIIPQLVKKLGK